MEVVHLITNQHHVTIKSLQLIPCLILIFLVVAYYHMGVSLSLNVFPIQLVVLCSIINCNSQWKYKLIV